MSTSKKEQKEDSLPIYPLFENPQITHIFIKDIETVVEQMKKAPEKQKKKTEFYKIDILDIITNNNPSRYKAKAEANIEKLKEIIVESGEPEKIAKDICSYRGISAIAVGSTINSISEACISLFLALSIESACKIEFIKQLTNAESLSYLITSFENAIEANNITQQDDLIVLLHKLILGAVCDIDKNTLKGLYKILQKILKGKKSAERSFYYKQCAIFRKLSSIIWFRIRIILKISDLHSFDM